jgi:hypothetical protein
VKRLLSLIVIASLVYVPQSLAAPKKINVKTMQLLTTVGTPDEVSGVVASGSSLIVFGSKANKAYARAVDITGKELWNLSLDQSPASIAMAAAVDAAGDITIVGATPLALGAVTPSPTATPINPDNAVTPPSSLISDLRALALWKISAAGLLLSSFTLPTSSAIFPTAVSVDKFGTTVVGILASEKGNAGFLVNADKEGIFTKLLQIGVGATTADAVVRHGDGSFTVAGSSSEAIAGKKLVGVTDGVLVKISKTLKITSVVRSSATKAKRSWNSASSTLLLGGQVTTGSKIETAVTKFSTSFKPSWTYRFASTGPTSIYGSTNAFFVSTAAIAELKWSPKAPTPLLLSFDSKGVIVAADSAPVGQKEVLGVVFSKELGLLMLTSSAELVSIFTLIPR